MTNNPRPCPSRSATASQRIDTQTMRSCTRGDALQAVRRGHLQVAVAPDVARINNLVRILCIVRRVEPTWVVHLIFGATCAPILEYMHMSHESPFCKLLLVQSAKKTYRESACKPARQRPPTQTAPCEFFRHSLPWSGGCLRPTSCTAAA